MYTESYIRYLLCDDVSLQKYYINREPVSLDDIRRSLMLVEREQNRYIPDHYYRLGQTQSFEGIFHISELFTVGLPRLADNYLELRNGIIYVKANKMNEWQLMLPYMPPLLLNSILLWQHYPFEDGNEQDYILKYFYPNNRFSAYPSPYIPQVKEIMGDVGLSDLHMHLNGALETDLAWQDFLKEPLSIKEELDDAFGKEKVREQYEQSSFLSDPEKIYRLLRVASVIRYVLFYYIYGIKIDGVHEDNIFEGSFKDLLERIAEERLVGGECYHHPMEQIVDKDTLPQLMEGMLYVKVLQALVNNPENDVLSGLFHYYLLILGLVNKMLVQQTTSYGFEEFQKITLNGLREYSEKRDYSVRFLQLSGNQLRHINLLEGRFSPKDSREKNEGLLDNILDGWEVLQRVQREKGIPESSLRLVAHFIKKADTKPGEFVRHKSLRQDIDHRADILILQLNENSRYSKAVLGIDAAASEFDTPPEVFAPAYRKLRKAGYHHFTYHAGEDFFHILSGLRAIFEAITYLDLQRCDRIGHATAAGVPVKLWHDNVGSKMLIKKGEHLDNLIFAYYMISKYKVNPLVDLLPILALKIDEHGYDVYHEYIPLSVHIRAWQIRYNDPGMLRSSFNYKDMNDVQKTFIDYHRRDIVDRYNKIIEIDTYDVLGEKQLTALQLVLLKEMHDREIVIETLPTSNVIIGNHHDYSTYHLYNWYKWKKEGKPLPPIVIGTDDTGIFATNIYNEYCNIYCQFLYNKQMNSDEVVSFLSELSSNARHYAFVD